MTQRAKLLGLLFLLGALVSACDDSDSNTAPTSSQGGARAGGVVMSLSAGEMVMPQGAEEGGGLGGGVSPQGGGEGDVSPREPYLELGTGFRRFEALSEGQVVPIIEGIQGGYHVWGALKGRGFLDSDISLLFTLSLDGEVIAEADYFEFELPVDRAGDYVYPGVAVIYYENERVGPSSGREMTLSLTINTSDGQSFSDEIKLRPVCCE